MTTTIDPRSIPNTLPFMTAPPDLLLSGQFPAKADFGHIEA
jgi:hypothetical protein